MTLDELEGENTKWDYTYNEDRRRSKRFKYHQPFWLHFGYRHQVEDHNNCSHAPIYLERT